MLTKNPFIGFVLLKKILGLICLNVRVNLKIYKINIFGRLWPILKVIINLIGLNLKKIKKKDCRILLKCAWEFLFHKNVPGILDPGSSGLCRSGYNIGIILCTTGWSALKRGLKLLLDQLIWDILQLFHFSPSRLKLSIYIFELKQPWKCQNT